MDRQIVIGMVEDYWRAIIPAMQAQNAALAIEIGERFDQRIEQTAELLQPIEGAAFRQAVEAEREKMMTEYQADPVVLKNRLGLGLGVDGPPQARSRSGSGLGQLAVRSAVRATIWESVWALFRAAR